MTAALEGGEWSAARPGRTLPQGKTRYPFYRSLGGSQGRSGRSENLAPHRDSIPDRPARSQSLYRLSYPAHSINIYSTIILPVVLYGCDTWSLTLREERRLRVFENRVLRRIFWPKRNEVTSEWRKLHNEKLNDLYVSPCIIQVIKSRRMG